MFSEARLRQIRFVEPLHMFDAKEKDTALHLQHSLGCPIATFAPASHTDNNKNNNNAPSSVDASPPPLFPMFRHDVMISVTNVGTHNAHAAANMMAPSSAQKQHHRHQKDNNNNYYYKSSSAPSSSASLVTVSSGGRSAASSIYTMWEPWVGCAALRYVERLADKMTCDNDTHHLLTSNQKSQQQQQQGSGGGGNKNRHQQQQDPSSLVKLEECSVGECATRDQLTADFSLFPGDVAWLDHGTGAVRCDTVSGDCVVHDFLFLAASSNSVSSAALGATVQHERQMQQLMQGHQPGHVFIARNSLIPDEEYFAHDLFDPSRQQQQQQQHSGYMRLLAGSLAWTPAVPLLSGCSIPPEAPAREGISLFALEAVVRPGAVLRVPLSAERHRSCAVLVVNGAVRVVNGDVDPVGVRCCRGDMVAMGAVGDALELRCWPEQDCPAGATVLIVSCAAAAMDGQPAIVPPSHGVFSAHSNSHVFAQTQQLLAMRLVRYDEGILAREQATIRKIHPLEVKNMNRQRRLLLLPSDEKAVLQDPFGGKAGRRGVFAMPASKSGSKHATGAGILLVALSDDGTTLQRLLLPSSSSSSSFSSSSEQLTLLSPISLIEDAKVRKSQKLSRAAHAATATQPLVEVATTVTILDRRIIVGFAPTVDSIVIVDSSQMREKTSTATATAAADGVSVDAEGGEGDKTGTAAIISWYDATPLFSRLRRQLRCCSMSKNDKSNTGDNATAPAPFSISGAVEVHGAEISLYCVDDAASSQKKHEQEKESASEYEETNIEIATFKNADLWKFLMTQSDDDSIDASSLDVNASNPRVAPPDQHHLFFPSLSVSAVSLPTLDTGARAHICATSAPLAASGAPLSGTFCAVQLRPLPENRYIRSSLSLIQSLAGGRPEIRRCATTGCGLVILSSDMRTVSGAGAPSAAAAQLQEFCPLARRVPVPFAVQHQMRLEKMAAMGASADTSSRSQPANDGGGGSNNNNNNNNKAALSPESSSISVSDSTESGEATTTTATATTTAPNMNVVAPRKPQEQQQPAEQQRPQPKSATAIAAAVIASYYVGEVPNITQIRAVAQIDAERFVVLFNVAPDDEKKVEPAASKMVGGKRVPVSGASISSSASAAAARVVAVVAEDAALLQWTDQPCIGIATIVSERNTSAIPAEEDVKLSAETMALRARVNDSSRKL